MSGTSSSSVLVFFWCAAAICCFIFGLTGVTKAQAPSAQPSQAPTSQPQATTDPSEVKALNSIFKQWGIEANAKQWNTTGDPCSGAAIDSTAFDNKDYNPFIKCDCSDNVTCHITQLKVYAKDVVGVIPEELWTLSFLFNLNLGQNYLTGPLSASIGNLTSMQYLNLGTNALSGELPRELGKLTELISFAIGTNNFSGPLPSELGSLSKLQQLYIDSSGVSGEIPSTFAKLQSLEQLWASDVELSGRIPDFIGNWSKLTVLRFQGNSFEGPIPSALSNLTSLTELLIADISTINGSSSLGFIKDMKSLTVLVLRNNNISDSIPSNIGEYQKLSQLDLSFNNLTGQIPDSLFNLSSLSILGYLAPEYAMRGHLTEKTDVFAFGVVILEIISGRSNCDMSLEEDKVYLLDLAWVLHENKREIELVDSRLSEFNEEEVKRVINIGLLCTQTSPMLRPSMSRVVGMLSGDIEVTIVTSKPGYLADWKFDDKSSVSSLMVDMPTNGANSSFYNSTASPSLMGDAQKSPAN